MMKGSYYINGVGIISPQRTFDNSEFLGTITQYDENVLNCVLPEFKDYINPVQLRRLSRMLRCGLSAATICIRDSNNIAPDGIITGTGYGFLNETAKFLEDIYQYNESQLTPTFFMQSTYNALAGLVALTIKCKGYNNTHVNKGFAFETSLHDAMMHLNGDSSKTFLVGSFDETDKAQYKIHSQIGYYKQQAVNNLALFDHKSTGTLQGEGTAFYSVSGIQRDNSWCKLVDVATIFEPSEEELVVKTDKLLNDNGILHRDISVVVNGVSGDVENDRLLNAVVQNRFSQVPEVRFKHLTGEYCTASSFGMWLGASVLKKKQIPVSVSFGRVAAREFNYVLVLNQYMGRNYSLILLKAI